MFAAEMGCRDREPKTAVVCGVTRSTENDMKRSMHLSRLLPGLIRVFHASRKGWAVSKRHVSP